MQSIIPASTTHICRALDATRIDENEYFCQMVNEDIDGIIRDIRSAHKHDSTSAPENSVAEQMKADIEEDANFKGSRMEKAVVLYCKQLGIDYRKLTAEEFQWLIRIFKSLSYFVATKEGENNSNNIFPIFIQPQNNFMIS